MDIENELAGALATAARELVGGKDFATDQTVRAATTENIDALTLALRHAVDAYDEGIRMAMKYDW